MIRRVLFGRGRGGQRTVGNGQHSEDFLGFGVVFFDFFWDNLNFLGSCSQNMKLNLPAGCRRYGLICRRDVGVMNFGRLFDVG